MKTKNLPCALTDTEIRERGIALADVRKQIRDTEPISPQELQRPLLFKAEKGEMVIGEDTATISEAA